MIYSEWMDGMGSLTGWSAIAQAVGGLPNAWPEDVTLGTNECEVSNKI